MRISDWSSDVCSSDLNAVLVRSMSMARRIEAEFITRRIPYSVVGGIRIDEAAHIKDLLSIARLACNLEHEPAWLRLLHRYPKISDKAAAQIVERIANSRRRSEEHTSKLQSLMRTSNAVFCLTNKHKRT